LAVSCFHLESTQPEQLDLFDSEMKNNKNVIKAVDAINDKYGELIVTPALMMGMKNVIIDRIAFGGVSELEDIYLAR